MPSPIGSLTLSTIFKKLNFFKSFVLLLFVIHIVQSSLLIGAIFPNYGYGANVSQESDEEIVFKHAVYISNQYKLTYLNTPSNYPTLLHKIIHISKIDQLKTIKKICKDTSGNILALIGPQEDTLKLYVKSLCEELELIHFDIEPSLEPSYSFNLYPALDVLCQAFSELIKNFEWKHAAIIYNAKTNLKKIRCLLGGPGQSMPKLDLTLKIANSEYEFRTVLKDISRRRFKNIILDLEPEETQQVLKMALQLGMINSTYHYIMTSLDVETMLLDDYKYNRANITAFRLIKTDSQFHKSISLNLSDYYLNHWKENERNKVLLKTKNALMFDSIFAFATAIKEAEKTLALNQGNVSCLENKHLTYGSLLTTYVEKVGVRGLTGLITFQNKQRRDFELDVLQLKENGLFKCGSWSNDQGLNFTFYDEVYEDDYSTSRKNSFRVVTLVENPYVIEDKDGKFKGFCIDLLDEIAQKMNFRYEIYKVADNQYGSEDANGTWNGMIRDLIDKKADLAISAFTINFKRQQVVDFTKPFLSLGISILYKVPTSSKPGLFSFLNPLSLQIWIYTLITYILVSLIMMVLARFSPYEWRNTHPCNLNNDYVENQFTVWNSLWFAVGTLMQQGSDINPKALSTRLVGGVWWFFTLIIISSYTANLAAFLTVEKVDMSITNVEELANQTKIAYGTFKGGSTMNFFKESRIDTYQRMWKVMQARPENSFVNSNEEGISRVLNRDYAYLMESPLIDYAIQKNCNLTQIGGLLDSKGYGIATQLGSPYTDDISLKILEMQEKGEIQKLYNRWWKSGNTCMRDEKKDSKANALNVENVGGIFVVLIGGCILAVIVSLFEFIYYAKKNSKKINKPICTQIMEELRFALKCGGSAKKIQLSNTEAISLKDTDKIKEGKNTPGHALYKPGSSSSKRECKKCDEIIRNELLENISPDNALVCKHDSASNLSIRNPGLLIVEKETAFDAQSALLNAHIVPHSHLNITHEKAKELYYNQVQLQTKLNKKSPKQKQNINYELSNSNSKLNTDYILMKPMSKQPAQQQHSQQQQQQQQIQHAKLMHPQHQKLKKPPNIQHLKMNNYRNDAQESNQIDKDDYVNSYDDELSQQQINYERYLAKSNNSKNANRH